MRRFLLLGAQLGGGVGELDGQNLCAVGCQISIQVQGRIMHGEQREEGNNQIHIPDTLDR